MNKEHKIGQCFFTIEPVLDSDKGNDDADNASTIEVSYPENMRSQMLELYFQGPKSGGRDDKAVNWLKIIEPGKCHINFELQEGML